jgi:hypothetical protein
MAGKIKQMLDIIIEKRSNGQQLLISTTKTKLLIKGIDTEKFNSSSEDNPEIINKVMTLAKDFGVSL